jgi:hypothetical protein
MEYITFIAVVVIMAYIMHRQQRTIDTLTNKLMARDYREYASMQPKPEVKEPQKRKPLSWYDTADIDDEDAVQ